MASPDLPSNYDAIVLGTGMTECVVAAALSRIGYNVLHMDRNDYYSGDWACFNWKGLQEWIENQSDTTKGQLKATEVELTSLLKEGESVIALQISSTSVTGVKQTTYVAEKPPCIEPEDPLKDTSLKSLVEPKSENGSTENESSVLNASACGGHDVSIGEPNPGAPVNEQHTTIDTCSGNTIQEKDCSESDQLDKHQHSKLSYEHSTVNTSQSELDSYDKQQVRAGSALNENEQQPHTPEQELINQTSSELGKSDRNESQTLAEMDSPIGAESTSADVTDSNLEAQNEIDAKDVKCENGQLETTGTQDVGDEQAELTSRADSEPQETKQYYLDDISSQWRKFNLDLMPKVVYSRGPMVELLISSDVAKYCEFKTVSRVLTVKSDRLERVPCSRSDLFTSKQVSVIEKRMMMKFLQFAMNYSSEPQEYEGFEAMTFCEYLKSKKLTANVCHYIQHAIAMVNDTVKTIQGLESCQRFLESLGRYGNTAFLWPLYGSGELPQCFCRMCAVFGGCYCLRRTGTHIVRDAENKCTGIIDTEGQRLNCKWLVMDSSYAPLEYKCNQPVKKTSRAIFITNRSILHTPNKEDITQLSYPRSADKTPILLHEAGPSAYACPKGMFVVQLTCVCDQNAEQDFEEIVEKLFRPANQDNIGETDERPSILWQMSFEMEDSSETEYTDCPSGVYVVAGPDSKMDFETSISRAREIFTTLCPDEDFLPKAPNQEDIIWNDGA